MKSVNITSVIRHIADISYLILVYLNYTKIKENLKNSETFLFIFACQISVYLLKYIHLTFIFNAVYFTFQSMLSTIINCQHFPDIFLLYN